MGTPRNAPSEMTSPFIRYPNEQEKQARRILFRKIQSVDFDAEILVVSRGGGIVHLDFHRGVVGWAGG